VSRRSNDPIDFLAGGEMLEDTNPFLGLWPRRPAKSVRTDGAPAPIGPYNQAIVVANGTVYCSGQLGIDPRTMQLVDDDVAAQAAQALCNLSAVLVAAGSGLPYVVKTTIFLIDMADFATVNGVYAAAFTRTPPARTTVAVAALPLGARVEIEAIALVRA
jgi:2-iminobutanoate/2-iminopropanoate deaminase